MANIPAELLALNEHVPAEDFVLALFRERIEALDLSSPVHVITQISRDQPRPAILIRKLPTFWEFGSDERFLSSMDLAIHVVADDPDGDRDASRLSEACRVILRDAWLNHYYHPENGSVTFFECLAPPRRVSDWATASGPVQYADLPSNVHRYEGRYRIVVRKPRIPPYPIP